MRCIVVMLSLISSLALAQGPSTRPLDPLDLSRLKNFSAFRSSSNNLYVDSNDDSKHPLPGETVVLADLKGPGIVTTSGPRLQTMNMAGLGYCACVFITTGARRPA